jgi:hypothetical protein
MKINQAATLQGAANQSAILEWEGAWANYMSKLSRLDELKAAGCYGYQLLMPRISIQKAKERLIELDSDFCMQIGIV